MKHYAITCTERITLAPSVAHNILHPHDTAKTYPVYTIDGERYIEITGDTRGGKLLTKLDRDNLRIDGGVLKPAHPALRVSNGDMPAVFTDDIPALTDITGIIEI